MLTVRPMSLRQMLSGAAIIIPMVEPDANTNGPEATVKLVPGLATYVMSLATAIYREDICPSAFLSTYCDFAKDYVPSASIRYRYCTYCIACVLIDPDVLAKNV